MPEEVSKRIRISSLSAGYGPQVEIITANYTLSDSPQFGGVLLITKSELTRLNFTVGDELEIIIRRA